MAPKPIGLNPKMTRTQVIDRLQKAQQLLRQALEFEDAGYLAMAHEALAKMFNDTEMLPYPDPDQVRVEAVRKYLTDRNQAPTTPAGPPAVTRLTAAGTAAAAVTSTGVNVGASGRPSRDVRSWSDRG